MLSVPNEGLTNYTGTALSTTQVLVNGLGGKNGTFQTLDLFFRPHLGCGGAEVELLDVNASSVNSTANLIPGCPYTIRYYLKCFHENYATDVIGPSTTNDDIKICPCKLNLIYASTIQPQNDLTKVKKVSNEKKIYKQKKFYLFFFVFC